MIWNSLKDLTIEKELEGLVEKQKSGDKDAGKLYDIYNILKEHIESGNSARSAPLESEQWNDVRDLHLLTAKPVLYLCNVDEGRSKRAIMWIRLKQCRMRAHRYWCWEQELSGHFELETFEERQVFWTTLVLENLG